MKKNNINNTGITDTFVSAHSRARSVNTCLIITIAFTCVALVPHSAWVGLYDHSRVVGDMGWHELMIGLTSLGLGILFFLLLSITFVFFLKWIYRAHNNLPALGAKGLVYSPAGVIGGFCIPILNLFYPFQIVREIWKASDPTKDAGGKPSWQNVSAPSLVTYWWILLLILFFFTIFLILGAVELRLYKVGNISILGWLVLIWCLLLVIDIILMKLIIKNIDLWQEKKHNHISIKPTVTESMEEKDNLTPELKPGESVAGMRFEQRGEKEPSIANYALWGILGFGAGGILYLEGVIGGFCLGLALRSRKQAWLLALAGFVGFGVGRVAMIFMGYAMFDWGCEPIGVLVVTGAVLGAIGGFSLGVALKDWRVAGFLALAGAIGFGIGEIALYGFELMAVMDSSTDIYILLIFITRVTWGIIGGIFLGVALGYMVKMWGQQT